MRRLLNRFALARRGNIAVMTAMLAVPLVVAAGGGIDIARLASARARLQDAVDAASVAAVAVSSPAVAAAGAMTTDGSIPSGTTQAMKIFNANAVNLTGLTVTSSSAAVSKTGRALTSTVTASGSMPTYFLGLAGIPKLNTNATATANSSLPAYIDFYLLLDNTPSMGVGATPTDVATMVANTPDQCAFACHDLSAGTNDYYSLAKRLGVTTRIDVLRSATQSLMSTAQTTATVPNQFRMGISTFGSSSAAPGFFTLTSPTSNLTLAQTIAGSIDLMTVPYQNFNSDQDTDFNSSMTGANSAISNPGDGSSTAQAQKVLFLVSDGVNDSSVGGSRTIAPINTALCTSIKNRGIKIAVLYTTYLPLPTNGFYNSYVAPFVNTINPTMSACASPGLFFEVSPSQGISDAMNALFQKAVANARISS